MNRGASIWGMGLVRQTSILDIPKASKALANLAGCSGRYTTAEWSRIQATSTVRSSKSEAFLGTFLDFLDILLKYQPVILGNFFQNNTGSSKLPTSLDFKQVFCNCYGPDELFIFSTKHPNLEPQYRFLTHIIPMQHQIK